jgi:Flp pilus assembly CpaF family ATPase
MSTEYATDYNNNMLTLNYRTTDTDIIRLSVRRMPLVDLISDTDIPEIRVHYHDFMLNGILSYMYSKQDTQTFDEVKALDYRQKFLADIDEIKQQEAILDNRLRPNYSMSAFT